MKMLRYNRKYLKTGAINEDGMLIHHSEDNLDALHKEQEQACYVIIGYNDLAKFSGDEPVLLHSGQVSDIIALPQYQCDIPAPSYINSVIGENARTFYSVFIVPPEFGVREYFSRFVRMWQSAHKDGSDFTASIGVKKKGGIAHG